jgi:hypothetical protein
MANVRRVGLRSSRYALVRRKSIGRADDVEILFCFD